MDADRRLESLLRLPQVARAEAVVDWPREDSARLRFTIPAEWRCEVRCNPHAAAAARAVRDWFSSLGCSEEELARAERFDVAGYVGIAFPLAPLERTVLLAKFVSLWLLWDDVHVESRHSRWRLDGESVRAHEAPASFSHFDRGWRMLFRELAGRRSVAWIDGLCATMRAWDEAAAAEASLFNRFVETGTLPTFDVQLELRIVTIGMTPTIALLEDVHDRELPSEFHELPGVERLKRLAGLLVGLGNEIYSFGKDLAEGHANLASNLILNGSLSALDALAQLIEMHDVGVREFDRGASTLQATHPSASTWLRDLRFATLGFTVWESNAPRYADHQVITGGKVLEPKLFPSAT